jgi:hypothetical protein
MLMIFDNPRSPWSGSEKDYKALGKLFALKNELTETGELVSAEGLAEPAGAKTIRIQDGATAVTDGPFVEAKEHLAGYFVLDCASPERAVEIAARVPDAQFEAVELRPVMDLEQMAPERP